MLEIGILSWDVEHGETLRAMLARGALNVDRSLWLLGEVLRGIEAAHDQGVSIRIGLDTIVVDGDRVLAVASPHLAPDTKAELFAVGVVALALLATHGVADREVKAFVESLIRRRYDSVAEAIVAIETIGDPMAMPDLTAA